MVKTAAEGEGAIVPLRSDILLPGESWPDEVREEVYVCFRQTLNAARARRWYLRDKEKDSPAPAERTIRKWIEFYAWRERADAEFRLEVGKQLQYENEKQSAINYHLALQVEADGLSGAFDHDPMVGALRAKWSELAQRRHERKVRGMLPELPRDTSDEQDLSHAERQQRAMQALKEIR